MLIKVGLYILFLKGYCAILYIYITFLFKNIYFFFQLYRTKHCSLRRICGVSSAERIRNEEIHRIADTRKNVTVKMKKKHKKWFGHVERMRYERIAKEISIISYLQIQQSLTRSTMIEQLGDGHHNTRVSTLQQRFRGAQQETQIWLHRGGAGCMFCVTTITVSIVEWFLTIT